MGDGIDDADPQAHAPEDRAEPWWRRVLGGVITFGFVVAALCAVVGVGLVIWWPHRFGDEPEWRSAVGWVVSMCANLRLHGATAIGVIALGALVVRRWRCAIVLVAAGLAAGLPTIRSWLPAERPVLAGETMIVATFNLLAPNRDEAGVLAELRAIDADVVCLQEVSPFWREVFARELAEEYPYRAVEPWKGGFGVALLSKRVFVGEAERVTTPGIEAPMVRAVVEVGGREVAIYSCHTLPPAWHWGYRFGGAQFRGLLAQLESVTLPTVVMGDFNTAPGGPRDMAMRAHGWQDAWDLAERGPGTSWRSGSFPAVVPGLRLDRVWLSGELGAARVRVGEGPGSDHRPVWGEVGFRE